MLITPNVVSSGSKGNLVVYDNIAVDVGLSYKKSKAHIRDVRYLFLTHEHGDHFNKTTLKKINEYRPDIMVIAPYYMNDLLSPLGIRNVMYIKPDVKYAVANFTFTAHELKHNVLNVGYSFEIYKDEKNFKIFHATDTYDLEGIEAKGYDVYAIEFNHDEADIEADINRKRAMNEFAYEVASSMNHMSFQRADKWLADNFEHGKSMVIPLHLSSSYNIDENNQEGGNDFETQ